MSINVKTIDYKERILGVGEVFGIEETLLKDVERCS
jgi:hypothetical protein